MQLKSFSGWIENSKTSYYKWKEKHWKTRLRKLTLWDEEEIKISHLLKEVTNPNDFKWQQGKAYNSHSTAFI